MVFLAHKHFCKVNVNECNCLQAWEGGLYYYRQGGKQISLITLEMVNAPGEMVRRDYTACYTASSTYVGSFSTMGVFLENVKCCDAVQNSKWRTANPGWRLSITLRKLLPAICLSDDSRNRA